MYAMSNDNGARTYLQSSCQHRNTFEIGKRHISSYCLARHRTYHPDDMCVLSYFGQSSWRSPCRTRKSGLHSGNLATKPQTWSTYHQHTNEENDTIFASCHFNCQKIFEGCIQTTTIKRASHKMQLTKKDAKMRSLQHLHEYEKVQTAPAVWKNTCHLLMPSIEILTLDIWEKHVFIV